MDLSIIIPVYNVAEFIKECLDSIFKVTGISFEVIIINDGSTDNSLKIISKYCKSIKNVKIITRKNKGLSATRNEGLTLACGDYVYFMDSDDFISPDVFVCLFKEGKARKADIIIGNVYQFNNEGIKEYSNNIRHNLTTNGTTVLSDHYLNHCSSVVWRCIFRRKFLLLNNLFFLEDIYYEDIEWNPRALSAANIIYLSTKYFYYYRLRTGSICQSNYSKKKLNDAMFVLNEIKKKCKQNSANRKTERVYKKILFSFLFHNLYMAYKAKISPDKYTLNNILLGVKPTCLKHYGMLCMYKMLPSRFFFLLYNRLK